MRILKDKEAFEYWKKENTLIGDIVGDPLEFPCFVTTGVENWSCHKVRSIYYYKPDFEEVLNEVSKC